MQFRVIVVLFDGTEHLVSRHAEREKAERMVASLARCSPFTEVRVEEDSRARAPEASSSARA